MSPQRVLVAVEEERIASAIDRAIGEDTEFAPPIHARLDPTEMADLAHTGFDVALIQIDPTTAEGFEAPLRLRQAVPGARIVVLANRPELALLREALRNHINGLAELWTPANAVLALLRCAPDQLLVDGDTALAIADRARSASVSGTTTATPPAAPHLTKREQEVLELLGRGFDTSNIAERLGVSIHTVRGHVKKLMQKLRARTQLQAVLNASELGILPRLDRERAHVDPVGGGSSPN